MCKSQIIAQIMETVVEETEVPEDLIRSGSKKVEVVDAKCIAIKIMSEKGIYPEQIARYMHASPTSIRNLLTNYEHRIEQNKIIAIYANNIRNMLETNC